jgi:carbon starvation protein CstA
MVCAFSGKPTVGLQASAIFVGCVQDLVILVFSVRRDGKSLGQMAREEIGSKSSDDASANNRK